MAHTPWPFSWNIHQAQVTWRAFRVSDIPREVFLKRCWHLLDEPPSSQHCLSFWRSAHLDKFAWFAIFELFLGPLFIYLRRTKTFILKFSHFGIFTLLDAGLIQSDGVIHAVIWVLTGLHDILGCHLALQGQRFVNEVTDNLNFLLLINKRQHRMKRRFSIYRDRRHQILDWLEYVDHWLISFVFFSIFRKTIIFICTGWAFWNLVNIVTKILKDVFLCKNLIIYRICQLRRCWIVLDLISSTDLQGILLSTICWTNMTLSPQCCWPWASCCGEWPIPWWRSSFPVSHTGLVTWWSANSIVHFALNYCLLNGCQSLVGGLVERIALLSQLMQRDMFFDARSQLNWITFITCLSFS